MMCDVLGVPRNIYYHSLQKTESTREPENPAKTQKIIHIHQESKERNGARKYIGYSKAKIRSITKKKYRPYSIVKKVMERKNLLDQDFSTTTINEKWVADIIYIYTVRDGWCYLASVMDLHSKKTIT